MRRESEHVDCFFIFLPLLQIALELRTTILEPSNDLLDKTGYQISNTQSRVASDFDLPEHSIVPAMRRFHLDQLATDISGK